MALELVLSGNTCNYYKNPDFPTLVFVERTDRFTVNDVKAQNTIPFKGIVTNIMSNRWMKILENFGICQNNLVATSAKKLSQFGVDSSFKGNMIATEKVELIPLECIARGYYVESSPSWEEYRRNHGNMYGSVVPEGLKDSQELPQVIYTPTYSKFEDEHGENIPFYESINVIYRFILDHPDIFPDVESKNTFNYAFDLAKQIKDTSIKIYSFANNYALERAVIIADCKLKFGILIDKEKKTRRLVLVNECLTPDTARFWDMKTYQVGKPQHEMDKQQIHKYVFDELHYDKHLTEVPNIPEKEIKLASEDYWEICKRLFDLDFKEATEGITWEWNEVNSSAIYI